MRPHSPFTLIITLIVALSAAAVSAVETPAPLSRQLALYHTLQQRIAQPGEISNEGLAGLQLLLAQVYSEMGMLQAAERTLESLQGGPSIRQLADMGHLLLARQYRQRGGLAASSAQLAAISGELDEVLEHERQLMLALSALERGSVDEAVRRYGKLQGDEGGVLLARFNYAALLLQSSQAEHGLALLQALGERTEKSASVQALRDRANLLLGYHFLKAQHYQDAQRFLQRVRLSGPYSRAALLALGWAELELRGATSAMVPWMELLAEGRGDSLDEEAELAIAAAIASKGASQRVLAHYQRLITQFEQGRKALLEKRQHHAKPYAPQAVASLLEEPGEALARDSAPGVALARLLTLREQLTSRGGDSSAVKGEESAFFEQLWPQLHALYPLSGEHDELSGVGVAAHVARRIEAYLRNALQTSSRSPRAVSDLDSRIETDRIALNGEITVVAEWYRRSRLAALQAHDERLLSYMERARLAIARNHDLALRRQERE